MCKFNPKNDSRIIDPCMKELVENIDLFSNNIYVVACCCGHGKYPQSIVVKFKQSSSSDYAYDFVSGKYIPRKKRFYKKDKEGVYYIPETLEEMKK